MSDTAVIQALLDTVQSSAPKLVVIPPGTYDIDGPMTINYTASTYSGGLSAYGVRFNSSITDGANLLTINVAAGCYCRGQKFMGLDLIGSKIDGTGLQITALGDLYNFVFRDIGIESFGGHGLSATGAIFEGIFENVRSRSNKGNGATLGNGATGGIMSTVAWIGGSCGQNGKYGMEFVNNAYDIKIRDTYFLVIIYFAKAIARASVAASRTSCWFLRHPRHPHWRVVAEIDDHVRSLASSTGGRSLHRQRPFLVSQREHISPRGFAAMLRRNVQSAFYRERARLISGPDFGNVHFETRRDLGGVKADARLPINPLDDGETR